MEGFFVKGSRLFIVDVKSPGGGELSLSACPGVGNRTSIEEKIANPSGVCPGGGGGGTVTARIESCISLNLSSGNPFPSWPSAAEDTC